MTFVTLVLEIIAALAKLFSLAGAAVTSAREQQLGAAQQRAEDMQNEEDRIRAASRAGLDAGRLPNQPDPFDRDAKG